jgi:hypothetical protein
MIMGMPTFSLHAVYIARRLVGAILNRIVTFVVATKIIV